MEMLSKTGAVVPRLGTAGKETPLATEHRWLLTQIIWIQASSLLLHGSGLPHTDRSALGQVRPATTPVIAGARTRKDGGRREAMNEKEIDVSLLPLSSLSANQLHAAAGTGEDK
ncbi:hypothetical protein U9M48_011595 [Paspalum notatum var. saurae]|uniref:Uncharacterized protein n=1 Tax=Paspalum notatum var. saurae TaxID=547442 RepID=A0AAQ3SW24_PASNO